MPSHYPKGVTVKNGRFEFDFDVVTINDVAKMMQDGDISRAEGRDVIQRISDGPPSGFQRFAEGFGGSIARAPSALVKGLFSDPVDDARSIGGLFNRLLAPGGPDAAAVRPARGAGAVGPGAGSGSGPDGQFASVEEFRRAFPDPSQPSPGFHPVRDEDQFATPSTPAPKAGEEGPTTQTPTGFRTITVEIQSLNPLTGELFTTFDQYQIPTITDSKGNTTDLPGGTPAFAGNPLLDQVNQQFQQQELLRQEGLRRSDADRNRSDSREVQSKQDRLALFEILGTPTGRNIVRILQASTEGKEFVEGLNLPPEVFSVFGIEPGDPGLRTVGKNRPGQLQTSGAFNEALGPSVNQEINVAGRSGVSTGPGDNRTLASRSTPSGRVDPGQALVPQSRDATGIVGPGPTEPLSFLDQLFAGVAGADSTFGFGPQLQGRLAPGTTRGFSDEELGALEAAYINSGSSLSEAQRLGRFGALPGAR